MLIYNQLLIEKFKLCYPLQPSKHNAPYKNDHCDTKKRVMQSHIHPKIEKVSFKFIFFFLCNVPHTVMFPF